MKKPKKAPPVKRAALGQSLGRLPGSSQGLVRPTLKPQGLTLSGVKSLTPPRLPSLSSTPPPSPLGGGQLGEQTAQRVVQTAKSTAPNPAQVQPQGLPASPVNPQGMPKVGSHGLAQRDVVASLIRGPGAGPTPPEAPYTPAGCEDGQAGGAVKAGGAGGSAATGPLARSCPLTAAPLSISNLSAHQYLRHRAAPGLVKAAQPPAGSVLSPNPATSPLTGVTPQPAGSTLPQLNPAGPFGSPGATFGGPSASGLFGPPPAAPGGAQPTGQPQPFLHALAAGNVTIPGQPTTGGGLGHFGTGSGPIAFPPPGGGSVLADHRQRMLLYGNGPEATGPDGEALAPRTPPAAPARRTPAPAPPPDPTSMAGRAAARAAEQRAAQEDPVGRAIVSVVKPLVTPIELLGRREHRPDTTMDRRPESERPVERHAPVTATPVELAAHGAALTPPGAWGRVLGLGGSAARVAAPAAAAEGAAARAAPLLGGSRSLVTPVAETAAPAAARAAAPVAEAAAPAAATAAEAAAPAAQATSRLGTAWNATRHTAAGVLDPLGAVTQGLARYGAREGTLPTLARWANRLVVQPAAAIPRYTTGSAFWGNLLRGRPGGIAAGLVAPAATAGLTGNNIDDAFRAPGTYFGRWRRAADDLLGGSPGAAADTLALEPWRRLADHTGRPLNRVTGNAAAGTEDLGAPFRFLRRQFMSGFSNLYEANGLTRQNPQLSSGQALDAARAANGAAAPDPGVGLGNPANPDFQHQLTDRIPSWVPFVGGHGGPAPEGVRRERADAHLARRAARAPGAPGSPATSPGLDAAGMDGLVGEYGDLVMRGDLQGAEAVRGRMLDAVGGDPLRLPITATVPPVSHTDFPGMTPEQFGAMIDQGEGLGQGAYARYQAGLAELTRMQQALGPNPDPNSPQARAVEERRVQLAQTRQRIQGRALQHYQAQVIQPMLERDVPAFRTAWEDMQARRQRGEPVDPAEVAAMRDQAEQIVGTFGSHALRRAVVEGVRTADGTPIRDAAEFMREAGRTRPVLDAQGRPVTRVLETPAGPVRVPVTEPDSPVAADLQANIDRQVLSLILGQPGVDEQGRPVTQRPVTQRLVDPAVGQTIFERMDDQSRMLTYAGLGLGAIGLLGGMFGFGGSWLPLLGLLGGGIGLHQATGGDFSQLTRGDFWRGLGNGLTGNRSQQDAAILQTMARPHAALGDSPMGQVSLATLQASPQFAQLVGGRLPAAQTLQTIAAVRPHEREQLRQLAAQNPAIGRMIDQVNQFEAGRGQAADAAAAAPVPAPGSPPPAGVSAAADLPAFYAESGVRVGADGVPDLAATSPAQRAALVARMSPALRQQAAAQLEQTVRSRTMGMGWGPIEQVATQGTRPGLLEPQPATAEERSMAQQALEMRRLLTGR